MKSITLSRLEDKQIVRNALESSIIFTAAVARLYIAFPHATWKYSGIWGAVVFCKDRAKNHSYFIRMVDMEHRKCVVWEQELYIGFDYVQDAAFFHTFSTDDSLAGLEFVDSAEADDFYSKVIHREKLKLKKSSNAAHNQDDFKISFVAGKGFSVSNNDPEVLAILHEFEKLGSFSATDIEANQDFIQEFIRKYKNRTKIERPPVAHKNQNGPSSLLNRQMPTKRHSTPPPPLSAALVHKQIQTKRNSTPLPPPPPLPNQSTRQSPPRSLSNSPYLPTPPLTAPSTPMLTYTKPPTTSTSRPLTPVTLPSPPLLSSSPIEASATKQPSLPPPPPPPPVFQANDRPLPTPTVNNKAISSSSSLTTNSKDSHHDLLAAIRSTGGFGSLKRSGTLKSVAVNEKKGLKSNSQLESHGMTASLAAVLQKRKTVMQSDDENDKDDSDDDWD
ncbi:hypothetical protein EDC96DRAFT_606266 [Choanephora cucurbitarum]|nr:hypothetical protein EDC96DRAFT_606266 [Choanephora cucurbitarum]